MRRRALTIAFFTFLGLLASTFLLGSFFGELRAHTFLYLPITSQAQSQNGNDCPKEKLDQVTGRPQYHYHREPPKDPLPPTLDSKELLKSLRTPDSAHAAIVVYGVAAQIKEILYQVPCYCGCDKAKGHQSLYDCFTGFHGVGCGTCQMEAIYVFEQWKKGKQAAEIRDAMERGEWNLNVSDYVEKHYSQYAPEAAMPKAK